MSGSDGYDKQGVVQVERLLDQALGAQGVPGVPDGLVDRVVVATQSRLAAGDTRGGVIGRLGWWGAGLSAAAAVLVLAGTLWVSVGVHGPVDGGDGSVVVAAADVVGWSDGADDTVDRELVALEAELALTSMDGVWDEDVIGLDEGLDGYGLDDDRGGAMVF